MNELHEQVERKFVENFDVSNWEVETDTGWVDIEKSNKTIEYDVWRLETEDGRWLECADNHIVFIPHQSKMVKTTPAMVNGSEEVFVKDLEEGDEIIVSSDNKYGFDIDVVKSVTKLDRKEHMYDLTVGGEHTYFTNGILSHNTLILGNIALNAVKHGKNVLYLTFEIDQKELRKRVDANFADFSVRNITQMREEVKNKVKNAKQKGNMGRFIIKEFPPASISSLDIESFLHTLNLKRQFKPDVIVLDYLGIMVPISKEHKNSYEKGKAVCEEIRCLSDRHKCPIITAAQTNRSGINQANVEMDNIADSMGIAHTADLIISLAQTEDLKENCQIKFEVIKSRISRTGAKGIVNIDYDKLKLINDDDEEDASDAISTGMREIEKVKKEKVNSIT
jgi:archaellum biogenesis ATPase FlaH